jgi:hypothetical protein
MVLASAIPLVLSISREFMFISPPCKGGVGGVSEAQPNAKLEPLSLVEKPLSKAQAALMMVSDCS